MLFSVGEDLSLPKIGWIVGSDSDIPKCRPGIELLRRFGVDVYARVMSAHRTPDDAAAFAAKAEGEGVEVIVCAAGMAAHLAGVMAAHTILPVIGLPLNASCMNGLDALLSTVQMPPGVPVATVGVDNALNAALLAAQILAVRYPGVKEHLRKYKGDMAWKVREKDMKAQSEIASW